MSAVMALPYCSLAAIWSRRTETATKLKRSTKSKAMPAPSRRVISCLILRIGNSCGWGKGRAVRRTLAYSEGNPPRERDFSPECAKK
ncbi:hypothetical protein D3C86_1065720 [compost metagenome]